MFEDYYEAFKTLMDNLLKNDKSANQDIKTATEVTKAETRTDLQESNQPCISCFGKGKEVFKGPCGHYYCVGCFTELCLGSLKDRSLVPVRCCRMDFPIERVKRVLNHEQMAQYDRFQKDLTEISVKNLDESFEIIVKNFGWKICSRCGAGIEKTQDCNHMTCVICRYEFCYKCGEQWVPRKCNCELWDPLDLERILDQRAPNANPVERRRLRQVFRHHDQHVHRWERIVIYKRMKKCATCHWVCNMWYWHCNECRQNSCGKCAFNQR